MHPRDWIEVRPQGVYCKAGDFYIDPMQPVNHAVVTHGHADHARAGHGHVWATEATLAIMRARYGETHYLMTENLLVYGETVEIGGVKVSLHPAGHILGSAQARLEHAGASIVFSGDYKRRPDPTCTPFEPVPCDVFVTEATFALPVFRHPPLEDEIARLLVSLAQFPERCHLIGVYALGKCQRMICALRAAGYGETIHLHGAMQKLCELYESFGIALGPLELVAPENAKTLAGKIVLCPALGLAGSLVAQAARRADRRGIGLDAYSRPRQTEGCRAAAGGFRSCRLGRTDPDAYRCRRAGGLGDARPR